MWPAYFHQLIHSASYAVLVTLRAFCCMCIHAIMRSSCRACLHPVCAQKCCVAEFLQQAVQAANCFVACAHAGPDVLCMLYCLAVTAVCLSPGCSVEQTDTACSCVLWWPKTLLCGVHGCISCYALHAVVTVKTPCSKQPRQQIALQSRTSVAPSCAMMECACII